MVPLINEIFGEKFDYRTSVIQFKNEHVFPGRKVVTDSHLYVGELTVGGHHYHIECQSGADGDIVLRMAEYDFYIAMEGLKEEAPHLYSIRLPHSAVLYLRGTGTVPEHEILKIYNADGDSIEHKMPVVRAQRYSDEEIIQKQLLILVPFYLLRYEKLFSKATETDVKKIDEIMENYRRLLSYLENAVGDMPNPQSVCALLLDVSKHVNEHILRKNSQVKEKVGGIMGGNIIEGLPSVKIFEEGRAEGILQGKAEGEIIGAVRLYSDELHLKPAEIVEKITARFSIDRADALKYVSEILGVHLD